VVARAKGKWGLDKKRHRAGGYHRGWTCYGTVNDLDLASVFLCYAKEEKWYLGI
jgi:hypothetical protein